MAVVATTEDPPEPVSARPNRFWSLRVVFMNGKPAPEVLWISLDGKREITIGRDPSAVNFVLADTTVSAVHAQIRRANDTWQIKDHQSRGGTFVNRVLARDWTALNDQSVVSFGGGVLAVVGADGTVSMGQPLGGLVGQAFAMRLLFQELRLAASEDGTIILGGPTGVGKSCCAKAIHDQSARKEHPFREFSCADFNENLIESELFGHKAGAYTGATGNRLGRFVAAGEGTLFLDEIAELPLALQAKLLGALQTRTVLPVGSDSAVPFHARIIVATHRNLEEEVKAKRFREDLYYRLAGRSAITLPPLSERKADLVQLVAKHLGQKHWLFAFPLLNAVLLHQWKGNVRELIGFISETVKPRRADDDAFVLERVLDFSARYARTFEFSRENLIAMLIQFNGNVSALARALDRDRKTVYRHLEQFGLNANDYVKPS